MDERDSPTRNQDCWAQHIREFCLVSPCRPSFAFRVIVRAWVRGYCLCMVTQAISVMMSSPSPGPEWYPPVFGGCSIPGLSNLWTVALFVLSRMGEGGRGEGGRGRGGGGGGGGVLGPIQPGPEGIPALSKALWGVIFITTYRSRALLGACAYNSTGRKYVLFRPPLVGVYGKYTRSVYMYITFWRKVMYTDWVVSHEHLLVVV